MSESALVIALVLSVLAAAPLEARFVLEVASLPVAELRVFVDGERYVYQSTHFLEEGPREHRVQLSLGKDSPTPEVLALLRKPAPGCRDVLEERTRVLERLCVERSGAAEATGTIAGEAFAARYDDSGKLVDIKVGSAHWFAVEKPVTPPSASPFVSGVAVPPGDLQLEPAEPGARWLSRAPLGVGLPESAGRVRCLVLAREEASRRPGSKVVVGLVIEDGRAYPHAWVTEGSSAFDPSVLKGDPILAKRRYLEVPVERSGRFFLRFFDGAVLLKAK